MKRRGQRPPPGWIERLQRWGPPTRTHRSVGSVTRAETTLSFEPDKGGMQAHNLSRWVNTNRATGPWNSPAGATVAA